MEASEIDRVTSSRAPGCGLRGWRVVMAGSEVARMSHVALPPPAPPGLASALEIRIGFPCGLPAEPPSLREAGEVGN